MSGLGNECPPNRQRCQRGGGEAGVRCDDRRAPGAWTMGPLFVGLHTRRIAARGAARGALTMRRPACQIADTAMEFAETTSAFGAEVDDSCWAARGRAGAFFIHAPGSETAEPGDRITAECLAVALEPI